MHIGIDLGRSKIAMICLDGAGETIVEGRAPTPADYTTCLQAIGGLVDQAERETGQACTIGVGTPGSLSARTGVMKNAGQFDGHALDKDLQAILGRPVAMANDANCFALSEATDGAAARAKCVFGVIIGTGVGGGIVVDGRVLTGPNSIAGEWGHTPLPWPSDDERPGMPCFCGKSGCNETFLSGPALSADHARITGDDLAPNVIARADTDGTRATMQRYEHRLARGLANVINLLDPDVIVLGGGLSNISSLYENVPKRWTDFVTSDHIATRLTPARYGDHSGVRGAAWLGKEMASTPGMKV